MDYENVRWLLSNSPSIKLMRAKNAPLLISFLHKEFKAANTLVIPNALLSQKLADFLEYIDYRERDEDEGILEKDDWDTRAQKYLTYWSDQNYIRKYADNRGIHLHELTADTEKALQWFASLDTREFVGTESRFLDIFQKLRDLIHNMTEDPAVKIERLKAQRQEIQAEITRIRRTNEVTIFTPTQIKERFFELNKMSRELLSDFKEVEQNFKEITRRLYEKESEDQLTKGAMLGIALDAIGELQETDQGRSFYAFWNTLISSATDEELGELVEKLYNLLAQHDIEYYDMFLRRIKIHLHDAGKKVIKSNHLLAEKLSRILAEKNVLERKRTLKLMGEIRKLALKVTNNPPKDTAFIEIDGNAEIAMIMERPLTEQRQEASFAVHPEGMGGNDLEMANLAKLFDAFAIDKSRLEDNIKQMLKTRSQVTLLEVVQQHPLTENNRLPEILTYMYIASQSPKHLIDDRLSERFELSRELKRSELKRFVNVPQVIFTRGGG